jgi:oligopeptide/dipeptide ABC transporter ATP-binding protein
MTEPLLSVDDLQVSFVSAQGEVPAVRGLSLAVHRGEALGLVGESGCGKSVMAASVLGLLGPSGRVRGVRRFGGRDLSNLSPSELRALRGGDVGMVFQDPMTSLDPVFTVGHQLGEALGHANLAKGELRRRCRELLADVGVPEPEARLAAYPGELSGGLRQRVMIAMATACRPKLLIADEPTTALDVTIQAQIMALLARLRSERRMALLLITHDLGVVAQNVDRVVVMYAGLAVEEASTRELFANPLHPYTRGLLGSMPGGPGHRRGHPLAAIPGTVPHPSRVPAGCAFRDRCPLAAEACADAVPALEERAAGHRVRCGRVTCSS